MLQWIAANVANIIITAVLAIVLTLVTVKLIRDKKAHRCSCGCSCSGCGAACGSACCASAAPLKNVSDLRK